MNISLALLVRQDWACIAATALWCSVIVTSAYAHSCRWLALFVFCSGVRFSKISLLYVLLLLGLFPLWSVHVSMIVVDERYTSLGVGLVLLWPVLHIVWCFWRRSIWQYSVFSGVIMWFKLLLSRMCILMLMSRTPFLKRGEYVTGLSLIGISETVLALFCWL